jgi:hypothetical protein
MRNEEVLRFNIVVVMLCRGAPGRTPRDSGLLLVGF